MQIFSIERSNISLAHYWHSSIKRNIFFTSYFNGVIPNSLLSYSSYNVHASTHAHTHTHSTVFSLVTDLCFLCVPSRLNLYLQFIKCILCFTFRNIKASLRKHSWTHFISILELHTISCVRPASWTCQCYETETCVRVVLARYVQQVHVRVFMLFHQAC